MNMTEDQLEAWIKQLIAKKQLTKFYKWTEWRKLSAEIMKENNYECQYCKRKGIHTPARSVHHVQWVRKHPRLAMSRTYTYNGETFKNLIPLCESCHNEQHPDKRVPTDHKKDHFVNEERW
jgi:5-methylcytosine-specific restriction endonuclease McrA|nr:MAG TPA: HNH endonuclease [Caudoviricetes sp.]